MSDITGDGFGSKHDWKRGMSVQTNDRYKRLTEYSCRKCDALFIHSYHLEPDIFEAMKKSNVKEKCILEPTFERCAR